MSKNAKTSSFNSEAATKYRSRSRSPMHDQLKQEGKLIQFHIPKKISAQSQVPWITQPTLQINDPLLQLHEEIIDFFDFMQPTEREKKAREELLIRIKKVIKGIWPESEVHIFGSYETGLWLPNSDLDIMVLTFNSDPAEDLIHTLSRSDLMHMASEMDLITSATVPILKFRDKSSSIYVDICFNTENGVQGVSIVKSYLEVYPEARYLVCVIKYFLKQRGLNETYSGGIGSFLSFCMVIASIQQHPSRPKNPSNFNRFLLSHYLVFFFKFFGEEFKYETNALSIRDQGSVFRKSSKNWLNNDRNSLLTLECPQNPGTDLARSSFAMETVKKSFYHCYRLLCATCSHISPTPLGLVIRFDETIAARASLKGKN